mmetsp:Transcript_4443/g.7073  ORF Transcript_4443/g.7073 Transcript_4443/m.7073 type:complete len:137 (-) Transcript_4443:279-689(-)
MKSSAVTVTLATLFVASTNAAKLTRKRTQTQHKSMDERYLGLEQNDRALANSMPMSETEDGHGHDHEGSDDHDESMSMASETADVAPVTPAVADTADETVADVEVQDVAVEDDGSGAMSVGTVISALASAGVMMLL